MGIAALAYAHRPFNINALLTTRLGFIVFGTGIAAYLFVASIQYLSALQHEGWRRISLIMATGVGGLGATLFHSVSHGRKFLFKIGDILSVLAGFGLGVIGFAALVFIACWIKSGFEAQKNV